jgi:hypothetical protein
MSRKIVSIAATPDNEEQPERLFALCDDGTVWVIATTAKNLVWRQLPDVPENKAPPVRS